LDCLSYCEMMPDYIMNNIYKMIVASHRISLEIKRRILPSRYIANDQDPSAEVR